jgi:beta-glucanase (GH16 family)
MRKLLLIVLLWFPLPIGAQTGLNGQWIAFNRASAPDSNLQCFRPKNVTVSVGNLVITTKSELAACSSFDLPFAVYHYTSGFVSMRNFNFLYGTVEFRAKFGGGVNTGAWPVVWMEDASCQASDPTGTDDNCNGQEIDIAEILHSDFTHVNQQIHVDNFSHNDGCNASATDTSKNFHVYQLLWSAGSLVFKIDGTTTCTITQNYVPRAPMYLKIDNFVGKFGGPVNNSTLPWSTLVDYVKVTQGSTVIFEDDFDPKDTNQPPKPDLATPSSSNRSDKTLGLKIFWRWPLWGLVICLVMVFALIAFGFRGARTNRGKGS